MWKYISLQSQGSDIQAHSCCLLSTEILLHVDIYLIKTTFISHKKGCLHFWDSGLSAVILETIYLSETSLLWLVFFRFRMLFSKTIISNGTYSLGSWLAISAFPADSSPSSKYTALILNV